MILLYNTIVLITTIVPQYFCKSYLKGGNYTCSFCILITRFFLDEKRGLIKTGGPVEVYKCKEEAFKLLMTLRFVMEMCHLCVSSVS